MKLRKTKAQMELKLSRNVKDNKDSFCKYTDDKRKAGELWAHC